MCLTCMELFVVCSKIRKGVRMETKWQYCKCWFKLWVHWPRAAARIMVDTRNLLLKGFLVVVILMGLLSLGIALFAWLLVPFLMPSLVGATLGEWLITWIVTTNLVMYFFFGQYLLVGLALSTVLPDELHGHWLLRPYWMENRSA